MREGARQLVDNDRKSHWTAEVWPTIQRVCLSHGCDPYRCYDEAAAASTWGKHGLSHNWWQLEGAGDEGFVRWVRLKPSQDGGGAAAVTTRHAAFSTLEKAVEAWCRGKRKKLDDPGCCLECHFEWEEGVAAAAFPPLQRRLLVKEHRELLKLENEGRLTQKRLDLHTRAERHLFARYAPETLRELDSQHVDLKKEAPGPRRKR